jgi:hypothetical protein
VAATTLPDLCIGWHAVDAGPAPLSALFDNPPLMQPNVDPALQHHQWRTAVEQDQASLDQQHLLATPVWYPLPKGGQHAVLPVYGGSSASWDNLIAGLLIAANESGFDKIRVANLVQWNLYGSIEQIGRTARSLAIRFDTVSAQGSTIDLFAQATPDDLTSMIVDVLRVDSNGSGRRDAARDKQELLQVAGLLDQPVDLSRLRDALTIALGAGQPAGSAFTPGELRGLRDHKANVVSLQHEVASRLSNLLADIRELCMFRRDSSLSVRRLGSGPERVRTLEVGAGAAHERELARDLIARSLGRLFAMPSPTNDMLIIAGAETLAPEVLTDLAASATRLSKQLVLLFSEDSEDAQRMLGHAGSGFAVFLRLANRDLAESAARFLGKQYTFVVNGVSIADGCTQDWNDSYVTSQSSTRTRGRTSGSNSGSSGIALSLGRSFGTSVSQSLTNANSQSSGVGGSTSQITTTSQSRVHEYVIEPEVFQGLDEFVMLVVVDRTVVLANCDYRIRKEPGTSTFPYPQP